MPLHEEAFRRAQEKARSMPLVGDYVLAHKWSDAHPCDPWAVGFYAGLENGRHRVSREDGSPIPNVGNYGFRYVRKIDADTGNWLCANAKYLERSAYGPRFAWHTLKSWVRILRSQAIGAGVAP